jgi:hypothetical protein
MRRKLFVVIMACVCACQLVNAQRLHKIIFTATDDERIGSSVKVDNDRANEEIDAIAGYIGYEVVDYVYNGNKCTKQNLLTVLNGLNCSPQDIVFFYYSGHGVHANAGLEDKFPQMCMNTSIQNFFVPARQVEEIIRSKNPRLRIIITDCCNSIDEDGIVSVKSFLAGKSGTTIVKGSVADNYRRLFVNARGKIMATSSQLGQTSGCAVDREGNDLGGYYSLFFWNVLVKYCEEGTSPTWKDVIATTKSAVSEVTRQKQIPYDAIDVSGEGSAPTSGTVPSAPTPTPTPSHATTSNLSQALTQLLSYDSEIRLSKINSILQNCFHGSGTVVTVGRNLKTVVEYESAEKFLRRIATNKNILRINVIKEETDQDGRPYVTVHEMRKGY